MKKEFKVGDKVFSEDMGDGEIIIGNVTKHYPILVSFSSGKEKRYTRYTKSGLLYTNRSNQSTDLHHRDEPARKLVDPNTTTGLIENQDESGTPMTATEVLKRQREFNETFYNMWMIESDIAPTPMAMKKSFKPEFETTCKLCGNACNKTLYRGKMLPWCGDCK